MADYYVDATGGSDSNDGTTTSTAWQTISHVNSQTFSAGDNIYFKRGETFTGPLEISWDGTDGSPITFADYDSGDIPIIDGGSSYALSDTYGHDYINCTNIQFDSDNDYVLILDDWQAQNGGSSNWTFTDCVILGPIQFVCNYTEFWGCTFDGSAHPNPAQGIKIWSPDGTDLANHNSLYNCDIHDFNGRGVWFLGITHDNLVSGCTIYNMTGSGTGRGVNFDGHSNVSYQNRVQDSTIYNCAQMGIQLENSFNTSIQHNEIYNCSQNTDESSCAIGVLFYEACTSSGGYGGSDCRGMASLLSIRYNLIHDNDEFGIHLWWTRGADIINNTILDSGLSGVKYDDGYCRENQLFNNIIGYNARAQIELYDTQVFATDDYNLLIPDGANTYEQHVDPWETWTLAQWQSATGFAANSISTSSPGFVDYANDDFHLESSSPAVDAGTTNTFDHDLDGESVPQGDGYCIGCYEYVVGTQPAVYQLVILARARSETDFAIIQTGQALRPVADVRRELWTGDDGQTTRLYELVDEVSPDDDDYCISPWNPEEVGSDKYLVFKLGSGVEPTESGTYTVNFRCRRQGENTDLVMSVYLLEGYVSSTDWGNVRGTTEINPTTTWTTYSIDYSGSAGDITDWTDLYLMFEPYIPSPI